MPTRLYAPTPSPTTAPTVLDGMGQCMDCAKRNFPKIDLNADGTNEEREQIAGKCPACCSVIKTQVAQGDMKESEVPAACASTSL